MNALRPFAPEEIDALGGQEAFSEAAWGSSRRTIWHQTWALPWFADPRAIFYWRDMLEEAGVDEESAFQTFEQMEETLQRLQDSGVATPWVVPTRYKLAILQSSASWIWGAGGDFIDSEGGRTLFGEPEARLGLRTYFGLYRYMPREGQPLDDLQALDMFSSRRAAVTMGSPTLRVAVLQDGSPETRARLGVALPPGPPLVGGSNLVIWQHARDEAAAVELVSFLLGQEAQVEYCSCIGYLPARLDALDREPFSTDPHLVGLARALENSRPFPPLLLGGTLEKRLSTALSLVWADVIADPGGDLDALIAGRLDSLAQQSWA
jgi:multiple sugar transport system substrate-binding protein